MRTTSFPSITFGVASAILLLINQTSLAQPLPLADNQPTPAPLQCDIRLFKLLQSESVRLDRYIFFLDLVTDSNYNQIKESINTSWDGEYGFFKGDWNKFKEQRNDMRKELRYESHEKYSREYAIETLDDKGLDAYKACLQAESPPTSLTVYRDGKTPADNIVTFAVNLKREVDLAGAVMVDLFGASKVLSAHDHQVSCNPKECVPDRNGIIHITILQFVGSRQFTIERKNERTEFRVTAQIAGLDAHLFVGPKLVTQVEEVPIPITSSGTFIYISRFLTDGSHDWQYRIDNQCGSSCQVSGTFMPSACICASGQKTPASTSPYQDAGRCIPPSNPADVRLKDVKPDEFMLKQINCGTDQMQDPMTLFTTGPDEVCYQGHFSLNGPPQPGTSKICTVTWKLHGLRMEKSLVFVKQ